MKINKSLMLIIVALSVVCTGCPDPDPVPDPPGPEPIQYNGDGVTVHTWVDNFD